MNTSEMEVCFENHVVQSVEEAPGNNSIEETVGNNTTEETVGNNSIEESVGRNSIEETVGSNSVKETQGTSCSEESPQRNCPETNTSMNISTENTQKTDEAVEGIQLQTVTEKSVEYVTNQEQDDIVISTDSIVSTQATDSIMKNADETRPDIGECETEVADTSDKSVPVEAAQVATAIEKDVNQVDSETISASEANVELPHTNTITAEISTKDLEIIPTEANNRVEIVSDIIIRPNQSVADIAAHTTEHSAKASGLSLLAQYDSDEESVVEVPVTSKSNYRNQVIEVESSSDSDSEPEHISTIRKAINRMEADDDEDDECEEGETRAKHNQPPRVKGELLLEDLPPIQDLHITVPEEECIELGRVHSIVNQLVLVNALPNSALLNLETVLFLEKGQRVLGEIFDVLGQVADPLYCVRFNSNEQILEKNIKVGDVVYVAPKTKHTQFVILSSLINARGSDASWKNDTEPPPRYIDYSDDEEEREARSKARNKNRSSEQDHEGKRNREDTASVPSTSGSTHYQPRGRRGAGGGGGGGSYRQRGPNTNHRGANDMQYQNNFYSDSWHSNYQPHYNHGSHYSNSYNNFAAPSYQQHYQRTSHPFQRPHQMYHAPPPHVSHPNDAMYVPNPFCAQPGPMNYPAPPPGPQPPQ